MKMMDASINQATNSDAAPVTDTPILQETISFLSDHKHLYNFQMTKFFCCRAWTNVPVEWLDAMALLETENLNEIPYGSVDGLPASLTRFIQTAIQLSLPRTPSTSTHTVIDPEARRGMTPKKQHEVESMAGLVKEICQNIQCDLLVDVGSGLGYLGQILNEVTGIPVLALEGKESRTDRAEVRAQKQDISEHEMETVMFHVEDNTEHYKKFEKLLLTKLKSYYKCPKLKPNTLARGGELQDQAKDSVQSDVLNDSSLDCDTKSCDECEIQNTDLKPMNNSATENTATGKCLDAEVLGKHIRTADIEQMGFPLQKEHISSALDKNQQICQECELSSTSENVYKAVDIDLSKDFENQIFPNSLKSDIKLNEEASCSSCQSKHSSGSLQSDIKSNEESSCSSCQSTQSTDLLQSDIKSNEERSSCQSKGSLQSDMTSNEDASCSSCQSTQGSVCMVGLHCCGSLTPIMLKMALAVPSVQACVVVGCCYHSMDLSDRNGPYFPMSELLQNKLKEADNDPEIDTYALRLAAQETRERWRNIIKEQHEFHMKNVAFRCILEAYLEKGGNIGKLKLHRKLVRKRDYKNFDTFLEAILQRTALNGTDAESFKSDMLDLYQEYEQFFKYIEPFTALQVLLQPVIESLIIRDRLQYLHEHGIKANAVPIFQEVLSPRNLALIFCKRN